MADMMTFPDTVEEFMEEYKLVDTEQVYTNGTELVPIFRMKQWFEHEEVIRVKNTVASNDCISRQAAIDAVAEGLKRTFVEYRDVAEKMLNKVPSAQPERKKGNEKCSNKLPCGWCSLFDTPCFGRGGEQDG